MTEAIESSIDRVRVYRRGATITRRAILASGTDGRFPTRVQLTGLPLALLDASVRVTCAAPVEARGIRVGLWAKTEADVIEVPSLDRLRELKHELRRVDATRTLAEAECEALAALEVPDRPEVEEGQRPPASPLAARLALDAFVDASLAEREAELATLRGEARALREQVADMAQRVARFRAKERVAADELSKSVSVELDGAVEPETTITLELSYFVDGARWTPEYQCRVARDGSRADLVTRAVICQSTGEDWHHVGLDLSTSDYQQWTELPKMKALRIGKRQPADPVTGYRPPPQIQSDLYAGFDHMQAVLRERGEFGGDRQGARVLEMMPRVYGLSSGALGLRTFAPSGHGEHMPQAGSASGNADGYGVGMAREIAEAEEESDDAWGDMPTPEPEMAKSAFASAPPPRPAAMPASPGAPAPQRARKKRAKVAEKRDKGGFGGGGRAEGAIEAPFAGRSLADFANLVLPAPDHRERGKLQPIDDAARYAASVDALGLEFDGDVGSVVARSVQAARSASTRNLGGGRIDVGTVSGVFDYAYTADARIDVPSDGSWHSVPLGTRTATCELEYVVVPRVDTSVFRILTLVNPTEAPLLPGRAELYVDGEYVLTTDVPLVGARGRFRVGLGVEQAIKCARNTTYEEGRAGDGVVATAELRHEIAIEIVNTLRRPIPIEVRERLPQPRENAEVVVEEGAVNPTWEPWRDEDDHRKLAGGRRWRETVEAGATLECRAAYVVKIYAQNELIGGNRRER